MAAMNQQWIIEVLDGNEPAYVTEHRGELYLTQYRRIAARFPTELDAKCTKVYIPDKYQPRIVSDS